MKNIKSTDPRKVLIVSALKRMSGGTKITCVEELAPNTFRGRCLRREIINEVKTGAWTFLGDFTVTLQAVNKE